MLFHGKIVFALVWIYPVIWILFSTAQMPKRPEELLQPTTFWWNPHRQPFDRRGWVLPLLRRRVHGWFLTGKWPCVSFAWKVWLRVSGSGFGRRQRERNRRRRAGSAAQWPRGFRGAAPTERTLLHYCLTITVTAWAEIGATLCPVCVYMYICVCFLLPHMTAKCSLNFHCHSRLEYANW